MRIIAECGANFDTIENAKEMIEKSKWAGADYAKFQLYNNNVIRDSPLRAELKERMLTKENAQELFDYGRDIGQSVIFTPMFMGAVGWIHEIGCPLIKIRYNDRHNIELVNRAIDVGKPVLMSVDRQYIDFYRDPQILPLYCISRYPAFEQEYAINPEDFTTGAFPGANVFSGVSDHTKGIEVMYRAKECGAEFCEVHVMIEGTEPLEAAWSKTFEDVKRWMEQS